VELKYKKAFCLYCGKEFDALFDVEGGEEKRLQEFCATCYPQATIKRVYRSKCPGFSCERGIILREKPKEGATYYCKECGIKYGIDPELIADVCSLQFLRVEREKQPDLPLTKPPATNGKIDYKGARSAEEERERRAEIDKHYEEYRKKTWTELDSLQNRELKVDWQMVYTTSTGKTYAIPLTVTQVGLFSYYRGKDVTSPTNRDKFMQYLVDVIEKNIRKKLEEGKPEAKDVKKDLLEIQGKLFAEFLFDVKIALDLWLEEGPFKRWLWWEIIEKINYHKVKIEDRLRKIGPERDFVTKIKELPPTALDEKETAHDKLCEEIERNKIIVNLPIIIPWLKKVAIRNLQDYKDELRTQRRAEGKTISLDIIKAGEGKYKKYKVEGINLGLRDAGEFEEKDLGVLNIVSDENGFLEEIGVIDNRLNIEDILIGEERKKEIDDLIQQYCGTSKQRFIAERIIESNGKITDKELASEFSKKGKKISESTVRLERKKMSENLGLKIILRKRLNED
jgi:hypothetical protein